MSKQQEESTFQNFEVGEHLGDMNCLVGEKLAACVNTLI